MIIEPTWVLFSCTNLRSRIEGINIILIEGKLSGNGRVILVIEVEGFVGLEINKALWKCIVCKS